MEPSTGGYLAILAGILFFATGTLNVLNKKDIPKEENKRSIVGKGFRLLVFILPFFILSFYFVPKFHHWNGTYLELYKYHNYPCENATFTTKKKMAFLSHHDGILPRSAYYITHNTLDEYKEKLEHRGNILAYVPKGEEFKVIGFYLPIAPGSGRLQYYLVQATNNNKTKAWVDQYQFNSEQCYPEEVRYYEENCFSAQRGTYGEEKIDLSSLTMIP